jgi:hypothetical protein
MDELLSGIKSAGDYVFYDLFGVEKKTYTFDYDEIGLDDKILALGVLAVIVWGFKD